MRQLRRRVVEWLGQSQPAGKLNERLAYQKHPTFLPSLPFYHHGQRPLSKALLCHELTVMYLPRNAESESTTGLDHTVWACGPSFHSGGRARLPTLVDARVDYTVHRCSASPSTAPAQNHSTDADTVMKWVKEKTRWGVATVYKSLRKRVRWFGLFSPAIGQWLHKMKCCQEKTRIFQSSVLGLNPSTTLC